MNDPRSHKNYNYNSIPPYYDPSQDPLWRPRNQATPSGNGQITSYDDHHPSNSYFSANTGNLYYQQSTPQRVQQTMEQTGFTNAFSIGHTNQNLLAGNQPRRPNNYQCSPPLNDDSDSDRDHPVRPKIYVSSEPNTNIRNQRTPSLKRSPTAPTQSVTRRTVMSPPLNDNFKSNNQRMTRRTATLPPSDDDSGSDRDLSVRPQIYVSSEPNTNLCNQRTSSLKRSPSVPTLALARKCGAEDEEEQRVQYLFGKSLDEIRYLEQATKEASRRERKTGYAALSGYDKDVLETYDAVRAALGQPQSIARVVDASYFLKCFRNARRWQLESRGNLTPSRAYGLPDNGGFIDRRISHEVMAQRNREPDKSQVCVNSNSINFSAYAYRSAHFSKASDKARRKG